MKISRALAIDAESIARVEITSGYPHERTFDALQNARKLLRDKKEHVFVAKENGKIVGYISLRKKNQTGEIGFLAVTKRYQKKGIGTRLGRFIGNYARKIGCKRLALSVLSTNLHAIKLYRKFRFLIKQKRHKRIGTRTVIKFNMEKRL